ncbi:MAG: 2OG-Fe(II) oxygenase [Gammaproteobacteria bacterium]|nr:2OG-Fe(II) oxygenase [Gammaproteobacteria bacterium]
MTALPYSQGPTDNDVFDYIATELDKKGYCITSNLVSNELTESLFHRVQSFKEVDFKRAGVGRMSNHHLNDFIRTDQIHWLSQGEPVENRYLSWMDRLRIGLNRRLYLGLFDYECHFAHYAPGNYYKRHLDSFQGNSNRVVTTVFYLNPNWQVADEGALLIYNNDNQQLIETVLPRYGTLVVFLSDQFPHEVNKANRDRYSIAGWFRVNNSIASRIDPPN